MTVAEMIVVAANVVIVLTGLGAAGAWAWAVWQWYHTVRATSARLNGQLDGIAALLRQIAHDHDQVAAEVLRRRDEDASRRWPIDQGPPS